MNSIMWKIKQRLCTLSKKCSKYPFLRKYIKWISKGVFAHTVIQVLKWLWGIQGPVIRDDPEFCNYNNEVGECFWYLLNYNCSLIWCSLHVVFLCLRHPLVFSVHLWPGSKYSYISCSELGSTEGLVNSNFTLKITIFPFGFLNPEDGTDRLSLNVCKKLLLLAA